MDAMDAKWEQLIQKYGHVLIERQENFSLFFGGRGHINTASERACGALLLQPGRKTIISNNIEIFRLLQEEADDASAWEYRHFPWYEEEQRAQIILELTNGETVTTDSQISSELQALRTVLTPEEMSTVREQGKATAEGLESVCQKIKPGMTELEIAGLIAQAYLSMGIEPIVNLVGSDERLERYRHFLPTRKPVERYAVMSVVTRYKGLQVSATRSVHFGKMDADLQRKTEVIRSIDAHLIAHTSPGTSYADLFGMLAGWYEQNGYPGEWQNHHQGGMAGYAAREDRLMPNSQKVIQLKQMYAWNPTLPSAKSEDTILVTDIGPEIVTWTGQFPFEEIEVNGIKVAKTTCLIR